MIEDDDDGLWRRPIQPIAWSLLLWSGFWAEPSDINGSITKLTQEVYEVVHGADANIQLSQEVYEAVHSADAKILVTQFVIEVVKKRDLFETPAGAGLVLTGYPPSNCIVSAVRRPSFTGPYSGGSGGGGSGTGGGSIPCNTVIRPGTGQLTLTGK